MAAKKTPPAKKAASEKKKPAAKKSSSATRKSRTRQKPASARKKPATGKKNAASVKKSMGDRLVTLLTTVFFVVFAVFVAYVLLYPGKTEKFGKSPSVQPEKPVPLKIARFEKPDFEIFPATPLPSRRAAAVAMSANVAADVAANVSGDVKKDVKPSPPPPVSDARPVVAIIIDDFGYDRAMAKKFMALDRNLTCAVLPHATYSRQIAELARQSSHEIMLHQPMEPVEYPLVDPGPGALLSSMTPDERISQLNRNLDGIPGICGINNHMGSRTTAMSDEMNQVFTVLKKRGLFFIDSRTTAVTQSLSSARLFNVPYAERDVFLDHVRDPANVRAQVDHLITIAEVHGKALGIGHPYEITYEVLKKALPELRKRVRLVRASEIVEIF